MNNPEFGSSVQSRAFLDRLIRHRWLLGGTGVALLMGVAASFALAPPSGDVPLQSVTIQLPEPEAVFSGDASAVFLREERIQRTDTIGSLANRLGIADPKALEFLRHAPEAADISRQLRPGKVVTARIDGRGRLATLFFPLNGKDSLAVVESSDDGFAVHEKALELEKHQSIKSGEIKSSLFGATDSAGIPDAIALQLAEIFGSDIDFYRDLREGDHFSVVYETFDYQGQPVRSGRILSAEFVNNQKSYEAFWFEDGEGNGGYFTADGKSLRKPFLRSPLEFSRVTSGFSMARLHPILQTVRAHRGIDYGAPSGTPVRSVANGKIDFAGQKSGYGNLLVVKHSGPYSTAYGHLKGFAAGIRKGSRVSQGDVIGYVGQTGMATGPHLHYEFRVNDTQVNPLAVAPAATFSLAKSQTRQFKRAISPLVEYLALARTTDSTAAD